MAKMLWAKLWSTSFEGDSFQECLVKQDTFTPLLFLYVVAKCKSMGDGHGNVAISTKRITKTFHTNYRKLSRNLLETWGETFPTVTVNVSEELCQFFFANWLEFQGSGKKKFRDFPEKKPTEDRGERIEDRIQIHGGGKSSDFFEQKPDATPSPSGSEKQQKFDLEVVYGRYPRKEGKADGMSRLKSMIKTQQDYDDFVKAVENYRRLVELEGRDKKMVKQFSSFVGVKGREVWRDYINKEIDKPNSEEQQFHGGAFKP